MAIHNTQDSWGSVAKFFHWSVSVLVITALAVGATMGLIGNKALRSTVIQFHKSVGLTVLALMIGRVLWRLYSVIPPLSSLTPKWQAFFAHVSHVLLYILVFGMTVTGWVMSTAGGHTTYFWFIFPMNAPFIPEYKPLSHMAFSGHFIMAWSLAILLIIHILGALKHHLVDKDNILTRMLPNRNDNPKEE